MDKITKDIIEFIVSDFGRSERAKTRTHKVTISVVYCTNSTVLSLLLLYCDLEYKKNDIPVNTIKNNKALQSNK